MNPSGSLIDGLHHAVKPLRHAVTLIIPSDNGRWGPFPLSRFLFSHHHSIAVNLNRRAIHILLLAKFVKEPNAVFYVDSSQAEMLSFTRMPPNLVPPSPHSTSDSTGWSGTDSESRPLSPEWSDPAEEVPDVEDDLRPQLEYAKQRKKTSEWYAGAPEWTEVQPQHHTAQSSGPVSSEVALQEGPLEVPASEPAGVEPVHQRIRVETPAQTAFRVNLFTLAPPGKHPLTDFQRNRLTLAYISSALDRHGLRADDTGLQVFLSSTVQDGELDPLKSSDTLKYPYPTGAVLSESARAQRSPPTRLRAPSPFSGRIGFTGPEKSQLPDAFEGAPLLGQKLLKTITLAQKVLMEAVAAAIQQEGEHYHDWLRHNKSKVPEYAFLTKKGHLRDFFLLCVTRLNFESAEQYRASKRVGESGPDEPRTKQSRR